MAVNHQQQQPGPNLGQRSKVTDRDRSVALSSVLPPVEQLVAILPALERAVASLPQNLHEQRDILTGMYLRNLLYSEAGRAQIETQVPGDKLFVLFDCQHAGAANTYGDGKKIDAYFKSLGEIFDRTAASHGIPHIPLRLGGDEFALVLPATKAADAFLQDVVVAIEDSRAAHLGRGSEALGEYVVERNIMRALRNEYRRECAARNEPISVSGFSEWLQARCPAQLIPFFAEMLDSTGTGEAIENLLADSRQQDIGRAVFTGFLQKFIATTLYPLVHEPAGRFSGGAVYVGALPSWAEYHLAESCAAKAMEPRKGQPFVLEMEQALPLDRTLKIKVHEHQAQQCFESRMSRYHQLREELKEQTDSPELRAAALWQILHLAVSDPNLPGALRAGLLSNVPAEAVLGKVVPGPLHALTLDVKSFGVVNNSLSYSDADSMLGALLSEAQRYFPATTVLRHGGGKITLLGAEPLSGPQLEELQQRLSERCAQFIRANPAGYERVALEFGERVALKTRQDEDGKYQLPPIHDLGACTLTPKTLLVEPGAPLPLP